MNTSTITVRVEAQIAKRLAQLAKATSRSRSFLAAEAIEEYLAVQEWQVEAITEGMEAADRGEGIALREVKAAWEKKRADAAG